MCSRTMLCMMLVCVLFTSSCSCDNKETPEAIIDSYVELLAEIECAPVHETIAKLEEFKAQNSAYSIADVVEEELVKMRKLAAIIKQSQTYMEQDEVWRVRPALADAAWEFPHVNIDCIAAKLYLDHAKKLLREKKWADALEILSRFSSSELPAKIRHEHEQTVAAIIKGRTEQLAAQAMADRKKTADDFLKIIRQVEQNGQTVTTRSTRGGQQSQAETGHRCAYCGAPAIGYCSMRQEWVCETHRYFTQNGQSWRCP